MFGIADVILAVAKRLCDVLEVILNGAGGPS